AGQRGLLCHAADPVSGAPGAADRGSLGPYRGITGLLRPGQKCSNRPMMVVERIVGFCCRWPWAVIVFCLLMAGGGAWYTGQNFAMNTDSEQLIDAKVGWRMRQARFDADFPQQSNITVAVIDGTTPELAESAAARLTEKLAANPRLFTHVRRPDGGTFFNQNGLLFLPL